MKISFGQNQHILNNCVFLCFANWKKSWTVTRTLKCVWAYTEQRAIPMQKISPKATFAISVIYVKTWNTKWMKNLSSSFLSLSFLKNINYFLSKAERNICCKKKMLKKHSNPFANWNINKLQIFVLYNTIKNSL